MPPTSTAMRVVLQPKRARPFYGRHPWVYAGAIASVEGEPADGDEVDLVSHAGHFIARGFYNSQSKIRVRLYSWDETRPLDAAFFRERLARALRLREQLGFTGPDRAYRLVSSEGDGLSGLVVDRYGDWLTMQVTSLAIGHRREMFADLLQELVRPRGLLLRTERGIGKLEGLSLQDGLLRGEAPTEPVTIEENGLRFLVNLAEGQKTGYYLDQRDNRLETARLASGRRVLDAFCYSGGFGLYAARAGAAEVIGIDGSEPALELARQNARLNGLDNISFHRADVFDDLDERVKRQERFGLIVLDPPKFARRQGAVEEALRGYRRLQSLALKLLEPEGYLVSCCCSGLITPDMLEQLLAQVASEGRREIQLLQRRGPSPDHPVAVSCLESHYLKCLITRVL
ncbi:MAG: class I SAM-dependent rRNA methyltransferase [Gemmataceae bacterium]